MGFFDLFKGIFKQPLPAEQTPAKPAETVAPAKPAEAVTPTKPDCRPFEKIVRSREECAAYFGEIFATEFSGVEIKTNVAASELGAMLGTTEEIHPACTPVDILVMKDGRPCLAIVFVLANTYRGMNVVGTKHICENGNLEYMRFFMDMRNDKEYVVNRLNTALN